mgnify:CR=1 FL=1
MTHLIRLEDEQIEILQTLVSRRIHDELDNFGIREEHDSLDYIDLANIVKDLGELLKALSEPEEKKFCVDPAILPGIDMKPGEINELKPEDPLPEPKKQPERRGKIPEVFKTCRTCEHCAEKAGKGRGTQYKCGLSGAWFLTGHDGCDAWWEKEDDKA